MADIDTVLTPSPIIRKVDLIKGRPKGGRGYLMVDDRVSGGRLLETPTLTCAHCGSVVILNGLRTRERGYCFTCNAYRCDETRCAADCTPIDRCLDLLMTDPSIPALSRTKDGGLLFDPELLRKAQF